MAVRRHHQLLRHGGLLRFEALLCMLLVLACLFVPVLPAQRYTFVNYGLQSGLANVNVTTLLESRAGVIWVGTQKGVFRANGTRFEVQPAFADAGIDGVWSMCEDNEGRIWVGDGNHLVYLEGDRVHVVQGFNPHIRSVGNVALIRVSGEQDAVYLLHDAVLERLSSRDHGKSWQAFPAFGPLLLRQAPELKHLTSVVADKSRGVWAICGKAICAVDLAGGGVRKFGPADGIAATTWSSILVTRSGEVWVRGDHAVSRLSPGARCFSPVSSLPPQRILHNSLPTLTEDNQGRILMNAAEGVARTDGARWEMADGKHGLPEDEIGQMLPDQAGGLWLVPEGRGISRWLGYGDWEGWTKADGLSSDIVLQIAQDPAGTRWIATEGGLDRLNRGSSKVHAVSQFPFLHVSAVASLGDRIWTGDEQGRVAQYDPSTGHTRVMLEHLDTVYQLLVDKRQRLWVCSPRGLYLFHPDDGWSRPHAVGGPTLPAEIVYAITEGAPGVVWVTTEKGIYRLDGAAWTPIEIPVKAGPLYNLNPAAATDGSLWVQTRHPSEIVHLAVRGRTASVLSWFTDPLMETENLAAMAMDRNGRLWVESDRGLQIFNGQSWVRANSEDGLLYDNPDYPAFLEDADGSVWIGTSGGLSHLLHPENLFRVPAPRVELSDALLDGNRLPRGSTGRYNLRRPSLTVGLLSADYTRGHAVVYRYRLEGLESAWRETDESGLRFPALQPGRYTLRVTAFDRRLHASSAEQVLSFVVLEPWWNRSWAHAIDALLAVIAVVAAWRLSNRLLVARQRELEATVAARTQELEQEKADLLTARTALIEMTRRDTLTGLLNRAAIFERMQALCEVSLATGSSLAIVMADIDHFKRINDEFGHLVGDAAIQQCATRIAKTIRPIDYVGRYGGEELLILMPGLDPASSAERMEELRRAIAGEPVRHKAAELHITCSFGVAWTGRERCALESLVALADEALYRAKKNGRNRVEFAPIETVESK